MISYLSAKVVPQVNSSLGASIVAVTAISSAGCNFVPHSLQDFRVSGLLVLHLVHLIAISDSYCCEKAYQVKKNVSINSKTDRHCLHMERFLLS